MEYIYIFILFIKEKENYVIFRNVSVLENYVNLNKLDRSKKKMVLFFIFIV